MAGTHIASRLPAQGNDRDDSGSFQTKPFTAVAKQDALPRFGGRATRACSTSLASAALGCRRALREQIALAGIVRERSRALEFGTSLIEPAELGKEIAPHARQEMVGLE